MDRNAEGRSGRGRRGIAVQHDLYDGILGGFEPMGRPGPHRDARFGPAGSPISYLFVAAGLCGGGCGGPDTAPVIGP